MTSSVSFVCERFGSITWLYLANGRQQSVSRGSRNPVSFAAGPAGDEDKNRSNQRSGVDQIIRVFFQFSLM
ncbi:hypothetical protein AAC387_Pa06g0720 [Persea americana]